MRWPCALVVLLLATACAAPLPDRDEKFSEGAADTAAALQQRILDEAGDPGIVDWAGEYYEGDGTGENVTLLLAPRAGFVFEWHGCMGVYDRNFGDVERVGEKLRLGFTFENCREGFQGLAPEFIPVRWGPRHYLVPADDVIGFCNDVNSGSEPRKSVHGRYLLRRGDEQLAVTGWPDLPSEGRDALLPGPVDVSVSAVGETTTRPSVCNWSFHDTALTLDAGQSEGLRSGMQLYLVEPEDSLSSIVRVTQVSEHQASAVLTRDCDPIGCRPERGWRLSTRPAWRRMEPAPTAR